MEDIVDYEKQRREFHVFVASKFYDLGRYNREDNTTAFNALLLKIMPGVKRYLQKRLNAALANGQLDKGKYKADDFIDQLFIEVYDHFDEIGNKENLYPWLFRKVGELLDNALVEEEFDTFFLENIDDYSKPEWDSMEEKFSTDGDGDLVMLEELDDISYQKNDVVLNPIFIDDDSKEFADRLDEKLGAENILKHTEMVLTRLPSSMRTVFELFAEHQFNREEIAKIRKRTVEEVDTLLMKAQKSLRTSFINRYKP